MYKLFSNENNKINFSLDNTDYYDFDISTVPGIILCTINFCCQISLSFNWLEFCEIYDKTIGCKFITEEYAKWIIRN